MTDESDGFDVDRLSELASKIDESVDEFKRAIVDGDGESDVVELAEDLWGVLDEVEDVLRTVDFEKIPEVIDLDEISDTIDVENVPEGLFDEEENAIELTNIKEAVDLRELWRSVDLTELYQEKQELEGAVDKVTDVMGDDEETKDGEDDGLLDTDLLDDDDDNDDEEDDGLLEGVVGMGEGANIKFDAEARQAVIEEKIQDAVEKFREILLETHDKLHKLYKMNQEKLGQPGRQPNSLNPTATSTMPSGPVPNSASLRASTVPSQVRHSRIKNPRRIYGRRFSEATGRRDSEEQAKDGEDAKDDQDAQVDETKSGRASEGDETKPEADRTEGEESAENGDESVDGSDSVNASESTEGNGEDGEDVNEDDQDGKDDHEDEEITLEVRDE